MIWIFGVTESANISYFNQGYYNNKYADNKSKEYILTGASEGILIRKDTKELLFKFE